MYYNYLKNKYTDIYLFVFFVLTDTLGAKKNYFTVWKDPIEEYNLL